MPPVALFFLVILLTTTCLNPVYALDKPFDHSAWDKFLKTYVNDKGEVDYRGVKQNPDLLNAYLLQISLADKAKSLDLWPREETLALWLNAYHAGLVSIIVQKYPVREINDIPGSWDLPAVKLGLNFYSLNDIRKTQLMANFRNEKIHLALSCAARSGPRLRRDAFTGAQVDGQLFQAANEFVNSEAFVKIIPEKSKVEISKIFQWYAVDFQFNFGNAQNEKNISPDVFATLSFINYYLQDKNNIAFLEEGNFKVKYLPFDWSLNEWQRDMRNNSASPASR